jgi:hypothetical protein
LSVLDNAVRRIPLAPLLLPRVEEDEEEEEEETVVARLE